MVDPSSPVFAPARATADLCYAGLACPCGGVVFRINGWPRVALGRGGFFWRSVTRVWREARTSLDQGDPLESPLLPPIFVRCVACESEALLLDHDGVADAMPASDRSEPREALRCRSCRRGRFALSAGFAEDPADARRIDLELVSRCEACHREGRIAWSRGRPSEQEVRLDLLYGRR